MTTIFDLKEVSRSSIERARKRAADLKVVGRSSGYPLTVYVVESGSKLYSVIRLGLFAFCDCPGFHYSSGACKHIAATIDPACPKCGRETRDDQELCPGCEMDEAPSWRQSSPGDLERLNR